MHIHCGRPIGLYGGIACLRNQIKTIYSYERNKDTQEVLSGEEGLITFGCELAVFILC